MLKTAKRAQGAACREHSSALAHKGSAFVVALVSVLVLAGFCAESSLAARGHEFAGSFGWGVLDGKGELQRCTKETGCQKGLPGSGAGQLGGSAGIAVNETTGDVYVVDETNDRVEIFNATGTKFEGEFNGSGLGIGTFGSGLLLNEGKAAGSGGLSEEVPSGRFDEPEAIAVDNDTSSPSFGDVYVTDTRGHRDQQANPEVVDKYSANGEYIGQITRNPDGLSSETIGGPLTDDLMRKIYGVAVDPRGGVWVEELNFGFGAEQGAANYTNAVVNGWIAFRQTHGPYFLGGELPSSFAVDSEDNLYLNLNKTLSHQARIVKDSASGAVAIGEMDEENPDGAGVESSSGDVYISHETNVDRVSGGGASLETLTVPGGSGFTGVAVDSSSLTVYVADPVDGAVDVFLPEAPGHPTVESGSESVKDVTATSASFSGEVNPRSEPTEEVTSYSFEYGPCASVAACPSSPFTESVPVSDGVLAANYEPDLVGASPQDLVAHTVYHLRLVAHNSHPGVGEGEELVFTTQSTGAFSLPDGRGWELVSPPNKYGALIQAFERMSQASADGGAITFAADAPIEAQPPGNFDSDVQALASRTATGWRSLNINAAHETTPGSNGGFEYPFFSADLSVGVLQPAGAFVPSLSSEASEQTPYLRTDFAGNDSTRLCDGSCFTPLVSGAPGFENVPAGTVFGGVPSSGKECVEGRCGPEVVGASRDGSHVLLGYGPASLVEGAPRGSLYEWSDGRLSVVSILPDESPAFGAGLGNNGIVRNAVSVDGSRVVWSAGSHLYLRDMAKEKTVELDEAQGGTGAVRLPTFEDASSDGARVFFIDSGLTKDSSSGADLYECEIVEEAGELKCKLTDLTGGGSPPGLVSPISGVSEDGSYVYLVAAGVLTGAQTNDRGEAAVAGQHNLYVRHAGVTSLIAVLSEEDMTDWQEDLKKLTVRVSPSGAWLAFMSVRPLTGFDNRDAATDKHDDEVFLYHAGEGGEGRLVCASCNPTAARPHGGKYEIGKEGGGTELEGLGPGSASFTGVRVAGMVPGWTSLFYQSRYLSNDGRLFFDSFDSLVPQDTNSAEDLYQFEPVGVGGCTGATMAFVAVSDGCVGLISSGTSKDASAFLDASESGGDVFFLTEGQLSPLDTDSARDIYDAHECGSEGCVAPVSTPVPACEGDACQSPGAPPEDPTPGSLTYQGPGNPPVPLLSAKPKPTLKTLKCKKGFVKQQGKCVKKRKANRTKRAKRAERAIRGGK